MQAAGSKNFFQKSLACVDSPFYTHADWYFYSLVLTGIFFTCVDWYLCFMCVDLYFFSLINCVDLYLSKLVLTGIFVHLC